MLQSLILSILLLVVAFVQPVFPSPESLKPITPQNAASLRQVAAIGSDTPGIVIWSPDGQTLAAVTSSQAIFYSINDLKTPFRTIPHHADENVSFAPDGHLIIGKAVWDIQKGTFETQPSGFFQRSPSGKLEVTSKSADKPTVVTIRSSDHTQTKRLMTDSSTSLQGVVFSPDEQFIVLEFATPPDDPLGFETAELWSVVSGTKVASLDQVLEYFQQIEFNASGSLLVTSTDTSANYGSIFEAVRIWDGRTGKLLKPNGPMTMIPARFSPDKRLMVYANSAGLSVWSDHEIGLIPNEDFGEISGFANPIFSADGKSLLVMGGNQIFIWDTDAVMQLGKPRLKLKGSQRSISSFKLSDDSKRLLVYSDDHKIDIWDLTQPTPIVTQVINDVELGQISPNSKWFWGISRTDLTTNQVLIDANTGERIGKFPMGSQPDPQWQRIAYWSSNMVNVLDLTDNKTTTLTPLPDYIGSIAYFDAEHQQLIFGTFDARAYTRTLQAYNLQTGKPDFSLSDYDTPDTILSSDGKRILSLEQNSNASTSASIREASGTGKAIFQLTVPGKDAQFFLLPDSDNLIYMSAATGVSGANGDLNSYSQIELWSAHRPRRIAAWTISGSVKTFGLNHAANLLAMAVDESANTLVLLDLTQPQTEGRGFRLPLYNVPEFDRVQFSPNDQYLAVSVDDQMLGDGIFHQYQTFLFETRQFDGLKTDDEVEPFTISGTQSPLFSPDNQYLLMYQPNTDFGYPRPFKFQLWRLKDKTNLSSFFGDGIAAFNPDGALLAIHNQSQTDIYNINDLSAGNTKPLVTLPDNEGWVRDLAFSPDGKVLYLVEQSRVRIYGVS